MYPLKEERVCIIKEIDNPKGNVLYLMTRDLRIKDNWALIHSLNIAERNDSSCYIVYPIIDFPNRNKRHYDFVKDALEFVEKESKKLNISFCVLNSDTNSINEFVNKHKISDIVIDQYPLRMHKDFLKSLEKDVQTNIFQVDAHNIVPVWTVTHKALYSAKLLRDRLIDLKYDYLDEYPTLEKCKKKPTFYSNTIEEMFSKIKYKEVKDIKDPKTDISTQQGLLVLTQWLSKIETFVRSNKPLTAQAETELNETRLSIWLNYGLISSQKCVTIIEKNKNEKNNTFIMRLLEQIIVRKELSDNFCYYTDEYDNLSSASRWAIETLKKHEKDKREVIYSKEELENCKTNNALWNYCQKEIVNKGFLNSYLRMYWAKTVAYWSNNAEEAVEKLIYLNDTYSLDGSDPNGYVGILWSICGIHDRAFRECKVFGKVRILTEHAVKRKCKIPTSVFNSK